MFQSHDLNKGNNTTLIKQTSMNQQETKIIKEKLETSKNNVCFTYKKIMIIFTILFIGLSYLGIAIYFTLHKQIDVLFNKIQPSNKHLHMNNIVISVIAFIIIGK
jgi:hypothetical protein